MKPHIRKVRGIWTVRMCVSFWTEAGLQFRPFLILHPEIGHGYTVREACEDWKAQMQAHRA